MVDRDGTRISKTRERTTSIIARQWFREKAGAGKLHRTPTCHTNETALCYCQPRARSSPLLANLVSLEALGRGNLYTAAVVLAKKHDVKGESHREAGRTLVGDLPVTFRAKTSGTIGKCTYFAMWKGAKRSSKGDRVAVLHSMALAGKWRCSLSWPKYRCWPEWVGLKPQASGS